MRTQQSHRTPSDEAIRIGRWGLLLYLYMSDRKLAKVTLTSTLVYEPRAKSFQNTGRTVLFPKNGLLTHRA